jgi:predicted metalloprotease with PDZ domain
VLVWLDVDTRIRELTNDAKSLDDFCKAFFGQHDGEVAVRTYIFEDVVSELQRIADEDWAGFFEERLNRVGDAAPLDGIERSGWRLEYTDTPSDYQKARDTLHKTLDLMDSIGLSLNKDGKVIDTLWNGPAFSAGISPGMTLVAVNGRKFEFGEPKWLTDAIAAAKNDAQEIALLMEDKAFFRTYPVDYHGGNRYPRLVRDTKIPDRLSRIIEPQAPPAE